MTRTLLAITLVAITALVAACTDDDRDPTTTPPAATTTSAPDATATPPADAIELTVDDPTAFPDDVAIIISTGCWQCDGPTTSLVRLRRTPNSIEQRTLFDDVPAGGSITGFAFDVTTGNAAVSTCAPNCTGLGEITGTEQTVIHTSIDGGASFTASAPLEGWFTIVGYGDGLLVSGPFDGDDEPNPVRMHPELDRFFYTPSYAELAFPMKTGVLWLTRERDTILAADGTTLFESADAQVSEIVSLEATGNRIAVLLFHRESAEAGGSGYRLSIVHRDEAALSHERTLTGGFIHAGAAVDECTLVANAEIPQDAIPTPDTGGAVFAGFLPALIDVCDGAIRPIVDPFTRAPYLNGRNLITAVQQGPFLAVADDIGDCLNVRESPALDAPTLGCFGAGVLLRDLGETEFVDGQTWHRAATPAGDEGWASGEFLEP